MNMRNIVLVVLCILSVSFFSPARAQNYIVGENDVLRITVYDNDNMTTSVQVSANGSITVPLLGIVDVSGKSVAQISQHLEDLYSDGYIINPQVNVFITEYRSKKVSILGQVKSPGLYDLVGNISLLQLISKAGGLSRDAGETVNIKRKTDGAGAENKIITIDLKQLVEQGDTSLDIIIQDGDSIHISQGGDFFVTGEVVRPSSYKHERDLTVIKAITLAGGFTDIAAPNRVRIQRKVDGEEHLSKNVPMDSPVLPGDVIIVPESYF